MRILIFHGYLLRGTGSNVYTANLARALKQLGHEVHLLCQDRAPEDLDFVDAIGSWATGELAITELHSSPRCFVYRPEIGPVLPVYVADRYEGIEAKTFPELSQAELDRYVSANIHAVIDVARYAKPEVALAGHLIMGPAILARASKQIPIGGYAVKIHGSALEYTVKPYQRRFLSYAREGLEPAKAVLVGSSHTANSLWETLADPAVVEKTRLGPPGVDIEKFKLRTQSERQDGFQKLIADLESQSSGHSSDISSFAIDPNAATGLRSLQPDSEPIIGFVGKLILSKGIDLLLAAWPLVLADFPNARLVIVGFGDYRQGSQRLVELLNEGDITTVAQIAHSGGGQPGEQRRNLRFLSEFLDRLSPSLLDRYKSSAAGMAKSVVFTGRLEHEQLAELMPLFSAQIVPSTFPEAFGMVAAEAAACGVLPICANHSGLSEVVDVLADPLPQSVRSLLSFDLDGSVIENLAQRISGWLMLPTKHRDQIAMTLSNRSHEQFSWGGVAQKVLAAAQGKLDKLQHP